MKVSEIAARLEGAVVGDPNLEITGFAPAHTARAGDLTFAENEVYFAAAESSAALAILVGDSFQPSRKTLIRVANARVAFAKVLPIFFPEPVYPPGVHPSAAVPESAEVHPEAHIGPRCVIGERVRIGARTALLGGAHVGDDCLIGDEVRLFPNVVL